MPLYTREDAEIALSYCQTVNLNDPFERADNFYAKFYYAGHILGTSLIKVQYQNNSIHFQVINEIIKLRNSYIAHEGISEFEKLKPELHWILKDKKIPYNFDFLWKC
jgi:predicted metal-dependent RNase